MEAIRETAEGIRGVSVERVWSEIRRILVGCHTPHLIRLMYELGVAECIGKTQRMHSSRIFIVGVGCVYEGRVSKGGWPKQRLF